MADPATVVGTASQTLTALALCGVMGLIGQSARAIVGLKSASKPSNQGEPFSPAYLLVTLMIGAVAGVVAGLLTGLDKFTEAVTLQNLLTIAAAGYAGADFIENAISLFIPKHPSPAAPPPRPAADPNATAPPPAPTPARPTLAPPATGATLALPATPIRRTQPVSAAARAAPIAAPDATVSASLAGLAPGLDIHTWAPALLAAFDAYDLGTDERRAAAIGQFLVEAGPTFADLEEDLYYTHVDAVMAAFGSRFRDRAEAEAYLRNPSALGSRVYADRLGNGDEASGDGYRYRGRGLIQLTGRATYAEFAMSRGVTVDEASAFCGTPEGAAMSGCWFLWSRHCLDAADRWDIAAITRTVNGPRMLGATKRSAYADAMLARLRADGALAA